MSLAQASNYQFNMVMSAGTSSDNYLDFQQKEIRVPTVKGAIPRYLVSYETTVYDPETQTNVQKTITVPFTAMFMIWTSQMGWPSWRIMLSRKDENTLSIYAIIETWDPNESYPSITFKLRISYMYPPNI